MDTAQIELQVVEALEDMETQIVGIASTFCEPSNELHPGLAVEIAGKLFRVGETIPVVSTWVEQILATEEGSRDRKLDFVTTVSRRFAAIQFCIEQMNGMLLLRKAQPVRAALLN